MARYCINALANNNNTVYYYNNGYPFIHPY